MGTLKVSDAKSPSSTCLQAREKEGSEELFLALVDEASTPAAGHEW